MKVFNRIEGNGAPVVQSATMRQCTSAR
jgi:hypothetical protein